MDFQKSGFVGGMCSGNGIFIRKKKTCFFLEIYVEYPR